MCETETMNPNRGAEQFPHILMPDGTLYPIAPPPGRRNRKLEGFIMGFQDAFAALATRDDLRGNDLRLVLYLAGHTDYENWINATAAHAAADLGIHRSHIYHGLTRLKNAGIIEKVPQTKDQRGGWRFANTFLWRGKVKNLHEERARRLKAVAKDPAPEGA